MNNIFGEIFTLIIFIFILLFPFLGSINKAFKKRDKLNKKLNYALTQANNFNIEEMNGSISFYRRKLYSLKPWINNRPEIINLQDLNKIEVDSKEKELIKNLISQIYSKYLAIHSEVTYLNAKAMEEDRIKNIFIQNSNVK